jgi:hypothetical protein
MMFNKLNFNDKWQSFETTVTNNNKQYKLSLNDFGNSQIEDANKLALTICGWMDTNIEKVKQFAASQLIDRKNNVWLQEDEEPVTETKFAETIELSSIDASSDGSFTVYFKDNDLFWGHIISVDIDQFLKMERADLAG